MSTDVAFAVLVPAAVVSILVALVAAPRTRRASTSPRRWCRSRLGSSGSPWRSCRASSSTTFRTPHLRGRRRLAALDAEHLARRAHERHLGGSPRAGRATAGVRRRRRYPRRFPHRPAVAQRRLCALAGTRPEETYYALGAATLALLPSSIWVLARRLGAGRLAASLGAGYGIAAVALTLVVDGAAENLLAMALAPIAFLFGLEALGEGGARRIGARRPDVGRPARRVSGVRPAARARCRDRGDRRACAGGSGRLRPGPCFPSPAGSAASS